jgi:REP element-mobilizing transposase RayT
MANTYTQLYVHIVFAVKGRSNLISADWKIQLYQYISGIITHKDQKLMIINGVANHIHMLIGFKPDCNLSDLVRDIKSNSSKWINEQKKIKGKFEWQHGFGAFTIGQSQVQTVINYIEHQEDHHRVKSFREEYIDLLKDYQIDYMAKYIFDDNSAAPTELE